MKIAYLIPALDAKGPNIFTLNLIKGLSRYKDFSCEVFHFNRGKGDSPNLTFPVKVTQLSMLSKFSFNKFDIIHSTMPIPDIYMSFHRLFKIKQCISSMHCFMKEDLYQRKGCIKGFLESIIWKRNLNNISNIIVSSLYMKDYYEKMLSKNINYFTISYGIPRVKPNISLVDKETTELLNNFKKNHIVLCGCGSLIQRKGFFQMISYLKHNTNAGVVLIGDGNCREELEIQATDLGVRDRVIFLGFRSNSANYYPFFDIFCMCSNSEGFGLAMLEAMSSGLPLVCSDLEIYKEFFKEGKISLFHYGDQESFNIAVDRVINNIDFYKESTLETFNKFFSIEAMSERHYNLYRKVLNSKKTNN